MQNQMRHRTIKVLLPIVLVLFVGASLAHGKPLGVPKYKQKGANDCGPAAMASALKYWQDKGYDVKGKDLDEMYENAKKKGKTNEKDGTRSDNLDEAADEAIADAPLDCHPPYNASDYGSFDYMLGEFGKGQTIVICLAVKGSPNGDYGHWMVINDMKPQGSFAASCSIQVMNPATGKYEWHKCDSTASGLQFPYDGGTATVSAMYSISPEAKVASDADTLKSGEIQLTYTISPGPPGDSSQRAKDFHVVLPDTGKVEGVPAGWSKRWVRTRKGWRLDLYDGCKTNGVTSATDIKIKVPGGRKVRRNWCRVSLTNSGDSVNPPKAPDRIWHKWAQVTYCVYDPQGPSTPMCCAMMPDPGGGVRLDWPRSTDNIEVEGYTLANLVTELPDTSVEDTSFVFEDPEPNVVHEFSVTAYDSVGNSSGFSPSAGCYTDLWGTQETPPGPAVVNSFFCPSMWSEGERTVNLTFASVLDAGETWVRYFLGNHVEPPIGPDEVRVMAPYYQFVTDAVTDGPLFIEIPYSETEYTGPAGPPAMYQLVGGAWVNITDLVDLEEQYVTGISPFGLNSFGQAVFALGYIPLPGGDASAISFTEPGSLVAPYLYRTPTVTVSNPGPTIKSFQVVYELDGVVTDTQWVFDLWPGDSTEVWFECLAPEPGSEHTLRAYTILPDDMNRSNDTTSLTVQATPEYWTLMEPMPDTPTDKPAKYGGWLAKGPGAEGGQVIYAAKGYKTTDFYKYLPDEDTWNVLADIPADEEYKPGKMKTKPGKKGCKGVSDGAEAVYMTRGANLSGFYRYDIGADTWGRVKDVPEGASGKRVKYGNDMVYVFTEDTGWIYLLKGYRTEFFRYNTVSGEWDTTLPEVPWGRAPKYKNGSFLVYDGSNAIYAHQANYYDKEAENPHHSMFRYDVAGNAWDTVTGMPVYCLEKGKDDKRKKSKDGACGAWYNGNMYALKGGNTQGFYKYFPEEDSWTQLRQDTLPQYTLLTDKKRRVKQGGDIVHYGSGLFYALKGNKTPELWRWVVRPDEFGMPARPGVMAGEPVVHRSSFIVSPNPIASGFATVQYSLPKAGPATVTVFDVVGRSVLRTWSPGHLVTGSLCLDLRRLSSGVYLVRLDADSYSTTQKLVVQE